MEKEGLIRIAELSSLEPSDADEFREEFDYIARTMANIPETSFENGENNICVVNLRCDKHEKCANTDIFTNAPRKKDGYIITKKIDGV